MFARLNGSVRALRGVRLVLLYLAVLTALMFAAWMLQGGGSG